MRQNEEKAARVFLTYRDFVKELTLRFAPFPGLSEDIFQEVFIEFVSKSEHWNLDEDVRPLLVMLTKRFASRAIDEKRKNMPSPLGKVVEQLCRMAEDRQSLLNVHQGDDASGNEDKKQALTQCLDLLPRRSRTLIDLYYFDGISAEKIADRMLISLNAVYLAIHRVRERLRKCIRRTLGGEVVS